MLGVYGVSDFDALHSGKHNDEVQLDAFDILVFDGDDLRPLPCRCARRICSGCWRAGRMEFFSASSNKARSVRIFFAQACNMGLEELVSKHRERAYRAGAAPHWLKVKNPGASGNEPGQEYSRSAFQRGKMTIDRDPDPNEAYEIVPMKPEPRGLSSRSESRS